VPAKLPVRIFFRLVPLPTTLAVLLLLGPILAAFGQQAANHMDSGAKIMLASTDGGFALAAAQGAAGTIRVGRLAAARSSNPRIKDQGQRAVAQSLAANQRLAAIVSRENKMTLAILPTAQAEGEHDRLAKLSGAVFDRAYVAYSLKTARNDLHAYKHQSEKGQDPGIRQFATEALPLLQARVDELTALRQETRSQRSK